MWQASIDLGERQLRLVLTHSEPDGLPRFKEARQWPLSVNLYTIQKQLEQWQDVYQMKLDAVVCEEDDGALRLLDPPSIIVDRHRANEVLNFWRTVVLPAKWQRGLALAMVSAKQKWPWFDPPERWVLDWLNRQVKEWKWELDREY